MKNTSLFILLIHSFIGITQEVKHPQDIQDFTDLQQEIFIKKDLLKLDILRGFTKITDTSFYNTDIYKDYGVKHLRNKNTNLILLEDRLVDKNGKNTGEIKILDYLLVDLKKNEGMVIGYCGDKNISFDTDAIYAVSLNTEKARTTTDIGSFLETIWKIDEKNGFQKMKLNRNFECLNDINYLMKLAKL